MIGKKIYIVLLCLLPYYALAQKDIVIPGSLFEKLCRITAIDSCGNSRKFPDQMQPHFQFYDFKNTKAKLNKFDRYRKKNGFDGMVKIYSDTSNFRSKYWCRVKGYYKIEQNTIQLVWDDNFKVEENFDQIDKDLSYWFLLVMNTYCTIDFTERGLILKGTKRVYDNTPICISLILQK